MLRARAQPSFQAFRKRLVALPVVVRRGSPIPISPTLPPLVFTSRRAEPRFATYQVLDPILNAFSRASFERASATVSPTSIPRSEKRLLEVSTITTRSFTFRASARD